MLTILDHLDTNYGHQWVSIDRLARSANKLAAVSMLMRWLKHPEHFPCTCKSFTYRLEMNGDESKEVIICYRYMISNWYLARRVHRPHRTSQLNLLSYIS